MKSVHLKIIFAAVLLVYLSFLIYSVTGGASYLSHVDEISYFNGAKLFYETGSLKSAFCGEGERSAVGEFGWYGPSYNLIYGLLAKTFGFTPVNIIIFHFLIIIISFLILGRIKIPEKEKLILLVCFGISGPVLNYAFTFFPVSLHIFLATVLTFLIFKLEDRKYRIVYAGMVFVFAAIHITFVLWIVALLFFSQNKKELITNIIIILLFAVYSIVFLKYFMAPAYAVGLRIVYDQTSLNTLFGFLRNSIRNISYIYRNSSYPQFIILLLVIFELYTAVYYMKGKSGFKNMLKFDLKIKILLSSLAISGLLLSLMVVLYDTRSFFLIKQIALLLPLLLSSFMYFYSKYKYIILIIFAFSLPGGLTEEYSTIKEKKDSYLLCFSDKDMNMEIDKLKLLESDGKDNIEIFSEVSLFNLPQEIDISLLPNSNYQGKMILYSTGGGEKVDGKINLVKSINNTLLKRKIDYIITKEELNTDNTELLYANKYYHLYRVKMQKVPQ